MLNTDQVSQIRSKIASQAKALHEHPWRPAGFFLAGFLFDILTLNRIDSEFQIIQLAAYQLFLTYLVYIKTLSDHELIVIHPKFQKIWKYHDLIIQFVLGAVLSVYTLFFFMSSSLIVSIGFMLFIAGLLVANEFVELKRHQIYLTLSLYSLCLICFWVTLVPVFLGFIGFIPFLIALIASSISLFGFYWTFKRRFNRLQIPTDIQTKIQKKVTLTGISIITLFLIFYFFQLIPPVPLSIQYMGIFRDVKKQQGQYILSYSRPSWKFWQNGDQTFYARPGDPIIAFVQVFAPKRFHDQLMVRWKLKTKNGWLNQDLIPLMISGGRDEGFRGYTSKSNYQPGKYRVQVETTDGREVGRIHLEIVPDTEQSPRELKQLIR